MLSIVDARASRSRSPVGDSRTGRIAGLILNVRLQITSGGYRTKHGQAIRAEFIEDFVLPDWTCSMCANSSMNSVRIA